MREKHIKSLDNNARAKEERTPQDEGRHHRHRSCESHHRVNEALVATKLLANNYTVADPRDEVCHCLEDRQTDGI